MAEVTLLLGGNIGDIEKNIVSVAEDIELNLGHIIKRTSVHKSEAWGFDSINIFYNMIVVIETTLSPCELLFKIWEIERTYGRERLSYDEELQKYNKRKSSTTPVFNDRTMDIDILYYGDIKLSNEIIEIPHPLIGKRPFVLELLNELNN